MTHANGPEAFRALAERTVLVADGDSITPDRTRPATLLVFRFVLKEAGTAVHRRRHRPSSGRGPRGRSRKSPRLSGAS
jgi:hypothetical protein